MYAGERRNEHRGGANIGEGGIGSDLSEHKVRYNLNYDRQTLIAVEGDTDVRLKGNDEHGYLSAGEFDGSRK